MHHFKKYHKELTHGGFTNSSSDTGEKCVLCRLQARLATPGRELVSFANMSLSQSTCKKQIATANSKLLVYLRSDQTLRPSRAITHLRHPSGWYSGALVVFWPAVIDTRSPSIQSDSVLKLRPILSKLVELTVQCPQIYTSSSHNKVQLCRMEKVLDWSSIESPLSRAPLDKPDGVEPTKPRGA